MYKLRLGSEIKRYQTISCNCDEQLTIEYIVKDCRLIGRERKSLTEYLKLKKPTETVSGLLVHSRRQWHESMDRLKGMVVNHPLHQLL